MKKIDRVIPSHFEFGVSVGSTPSIAIKVNGIRGEEITIPVDATEAHQIGVYIAGLAHAVRRAAAAGEEMPSDDDYEQLRELIR